MKGKLTLGLIVAFSAAVGGAAEAPSETSTSKSIATPAQAPAPVTSLPKPEEMARAIPIGTGPVPNANGTEIWFGKPGNMSVRGTTHAEMIPVLPEPSKATGSAMVILPGGGFMTLSWDHEGMKVARALADRGIAAFVLKYRLDPTPRDWPSFGKFVGARMTNWIGKPGEGLRITTPQFAIDDGIAALKIVRSRARTWQVDPARVGIIGFSAGARTAIRVTLDAPQKDRPSLVALVYPPMERVSVPPGAPPAFVIMATDDPLSGRAGYGLIESWIAASRPIEFHAFQKGGHGFGLGAPQTTTQGWLDGLVRWLEMNRFFSRASNR